MCGSMLGAGRQGVAPVRRKAEMRRVHRLQNPFEHWMRGLATEVLVSIAFIGAGVLMSFVVAALL